MNNKTHSICYFGVIDATYSSNQIFMEGLRANNVSVLEVMVNDPITDLNQRNQMSIVDLSKRLFKKLLIIPEVIKNLGRIRTVDAIFVGYPGHFNVPIAYLVSKLFSKLLVFYPVISISTTFTDDIGLISKKSLAVKLMMSFERLIYGLCDVVIADGSEQAKFLASSFDIPKEKLHSVYLGANDRLYRYKCARGATGEFIVVYYGLYSPIHGVEHVVHAAELCKKNHHIKFWFIGNGQTYNEIKKLAENLKTTNITFFPDIREPQALPLLEKADVFLGFMQDSPSVKRQVPNKVYQGLSLGKAVVTVDSPIMRKLLSHGNSVYLCKPADPKDLAHALITLEGNRALTREMGLQARRLFERQLTPRAVAKRIINIIDL